MINSPGFCFFSPDSLQEEHEDQKTSQSYKAGVFVHVMHLYFYANKKAIVAFS